MNKKSLIISIIVIIVILAIISLSLVLNKSNVNLENLEKELLFECSELNLRKLDKEEITRYFGIDVVDVDEVLFVTDFVDENKPFSPNILIVIVNSRNYHDYYNTLKSYLDTEISNSTDYNRIKLYQDTLIKESRNYFYLILGSNKDIIKVINNYYK